MAWAGAVATLFFVVLAEVAAAEEAVVGRIPLTRHESASSVGSRRPSDEATPSRILVGSSPQYDEHVALLAVHLAAAAYCVPSWLEAWNCTPCAAVGHWRLQSWAFDNDTDTFGYLATSGARAVLAFRGTNPHDINNLETDLRSVAKTRYPPAVNGSEVGSGWVKAWGVLGSTLGPAVLSLLEKRPSLSLLLTGHSMGASLAYVAAVDLFAVPRLRPGGGLTLITFGSPRTGNQAFADFVATSPVLSNSWRVTHARDPIVHLPPDLLGFEHMGPEVWYTTSQKPDKNVTQPPGPYVVCEGGEDPSCSHGMWLDYPSDHLCYVGVAVSQLCSSTPEAPLPLAASARGGELGREEGSVEVNV